jgi:hypothetical protein
MQTYWQGPRRGTESSRRNGRRGRLGCGPVASLNFPAAAAQSPSDSSRLGHGCGCAFTRTSVGSAKPVVWFERGHSRKVSGNEPPLAQPWRGKLAAPTRSRTVHGHGLAAGWTRARTGHGLASGPVYGADVPRPNRDSFADTKALSTQGVRRVPSKTDR